MPSSPRGFSRMLHDVTMMMFIEVFLCSGSVVAQWCSRLQVIPEVFFTSRAKPTKPCGAWDCEHIHDEHSTANEEEQRKEPSDNVEELA